MFLFHSSEYLILQSCRDALLICKRWPYVAIRVILLFACITESGYSICRQYCVALCKLISAAQTGHVISLQFLTHIHQYLIEQHNLLINLATLCPFTNTKVNVDFNYDYINHVNLKKVLYSNAPIADGGGYYKNNDRSIPDEEEAPMDRSIKVNSCQLSPSENDNTMNKAPSLTNKDKSPCKLPILNVLFPQARQKSYINARYVTETSSI